MTTVVHIDKNPDPFLARAGALIKASPAEHNLILSMCQSAAGKIARGTPCGTLFMTVTADDGSVLQAAVMSPSRNLVLSQAFVAGDVAIPALAEKLAAEKISFPGIVGPSDVASAFAQGWSDATQQRFNEYMDQIIYSLREVIEPRSTGGVVRPARDTEEELIASWMKDFARESLPKAEWMTDTESRTRAQERIGAGSVYVLDVAGKPVAQAAIAGTTDVARVSMVYTPEESRGRGYASAIVARISQHALDEGCAMCCLYADARNPVSNSIYRKIGYEFVGRSSLYVVEKL
jgi:predicted GNAT family acetyltransferase